MPFRERRKTLKEVFEQIIAGILLVEKEFAIETGEVKKQKAIDIINAMVDIPSVPEFIEAKIIEVVIDLVVYIFNKYGIFKT